MKKKILIFVFLGFSFLLNIKHAHAFIYFDDGAGQYYPVQAGAGGISQSITTNFAHEYILIGVSFNNIGTPVVSSVTCSGNPATAVEVGGATGGGTQSNLWYYYADTASTYGCDVVYSGTHNAYMSLAAFGGISYSNGTGVTSTIDSAQQIGQFNLSATQTVNATATFANDTFIGVGLSDSCTPSATGTTIQVTQSTGNDGQGFYQDILLLTGNRTLQQTGSCTSDLTMSSALFKAESSSPSPTSPIVGAFLYPYVGVLNPDFTNWQIGFSAATGSTVYAKIDYQRGTSWSFTNTIFEDRLNYNMGTDSAIILPVLKQNSLWGNFDQNSTTTFPWIARLYLSTSTNFSNATSAEIYFNIGLTTSSVALNSSTQSAGPFTYNPFQQIPSYDFTSVTSSVANLFSSSSTQDCIPASDWTDIGGGFYYGLCRITNFLFTPDFTVTQSFNSAVSSTMKVFPISWLLSPLQAISNASSTGSSTPISAYDFPSNQYGNTSTLTMEDPTQNSQFGAKARVVFNLWYNFVIYVVIGILLLLIIIILRHRN